MIYTSILQLISAAQPDSQLSLVSAAQPDSFHTVLYSLAALPRSVPPSSAC